MEFLEDVEQVRKNHPNLVFDADKKELKGTISVLDTQSGYEKILDRYNIKICVIYGYPLVFFPKVFELDGKIPAEARRHINPDGSFCLSVRPEEFLICRKGLTISRFIDEIVVPFLAVQTLFNEDLTDKFPQGEHDHGGEGVLEYYQDFLKISDPKIILEGFRIVLRDRVSRNSRCFCGSTQKTKRCHIESLNKLRNYPRNLLKLDYEDIKSTLT